MGACCASCAVGKACEGSCRGGARRPAFRSLSPGSLAAASRLTQPARALPLGEELVVGGHNFGRPVNMDAEARPSGGSKPVNSDAGGPWEIDYAALDRRMRRARAAAFVADPLTSAATSSFRTSGDPPEVMTYGSALSRPIGQPPELVRLEASLAQEVASAQTAAARKIAEAQTRAVQEAAAATSDAQLKDIQAQAQRDADAARAEASLRIATARAAAEQEARRQIDRADAARASSSDAWTRFRDCLCGTGPDLGASQGYGSQVPGLGAAMPRTSGDPPTPGSAFDPNGPIGGQYGSMGGLGQAYNFGQQQPQQPQQQPGGPSAGQVFGGIAGAGLGVLGGYLQGEAQQNIAQTQAGAAMTIAQIQAHAQQAMAAAQVAAAQAQSQAAQAQAAAQLATAQANVALAQQGIVPPGYQPAAPVNPQPPAADPNAPQPMSTGAKVGLALGGAAILAGLAYLATQKPAGVPSAHYPVQRGY